MNDENSCESGYQELSSPLDLSVGSADGVIIDKHEEPYPNNEEDLGPNEGCLFIQEDEPFSNGLNNNDFTITKIGASSKKVPAEEISLNGEAGIIKKREKKKKVRMEDRLKMAVLVCEWNMCTVSLSHLATFLKHVTEHIAMLDENPTDDGFVCFWRNCGFASNVKAELESHIHYHGFHSKIKGIGLVIMQEQNLQCMLPNDTRNILPQVPKMFECSWSYCGHCFTFAQHFYWHVMGHAHAQTMDESKNIYCGWMGCRWKTGVLKRLQDHSYSHTQEKIVGCPTCGSLFAGANKFVDHCKRQQQSDEFECTHCQRKFISDPILQDHIRWHISNYKCPHCKMTCVSQSTLRTHIKYKHSNERPFKCPECEKSFKASSDVVKHMIVHSEEPSFICAYEGCKVSCKSQTGFNSHLRKVHELDKPAKPYKCHMCKDEFALGEGLSRHLKKDHDLQLPNGHSRFRFNKDPDGFYRLQTSRFESIELAQKLLEEEMAANSANIQPAQQHLNGRETQHENVGLHSESDEVDDPLSIDKLTELKIKIEAVADSKKRKREEKKRKREEKKKKTKRDIKSELEDSKPTIVNHEVWPDMPLLLPKEHKLQQNTKNEQIRLTKKHTTAKPKKEKKLVKKEAKEKRKCAKKSSPQQCEGNVAVQNDKVTSPSNQIPNLSNTRTSLRKAARGGSA